MSLSLSAPAPHHARNPWPAVIAAGLATFSVVTTEMLPVGLLTAIAPSLGMTTGQAGLMVSLPALLAAVFAPLVVVMAGRMDRRRMLAALLALLALANTASALAPSWGWMLAARVLLGLCIGGIWAVAGDWRRAWCQRLPSGSPPPSSLAGWPPHRCWACQWAR